MTRAATSIRASAPRSRPVISQSIHTSRSFTGSHPTHALGRAPALRHGSGTPPRVGGVKDWIGLVARLVTGGVWIVAGLLKLPDPAGSVRAVRAYDLLPESVVPTVGHALPILEVVVGALPRARPADPGHGRGVGAAVRRLHHRDRLGLGARAGDRLRLLRRRRPARRRLGQVPRRDRPRRRPAAGVAVARRTAADPMVAGLADLPDPLGGPDDTTTTHRRGTLDVEAQQGR